MTALNNDELLAVWNRAEYLYRNGMDDDSSRMEYTELCRILTENHFDTPEDLDLLQKKVELITEGWGPEEWAKYEEMIKLEMHER